MEDLTQYPNIGPVLAQKLQSAGIMTLEELIRVGSIEAMLRMGETNLSASANMLYALEGAIQGLRWHQIPKSERDNLWNEFKQVVDQAFGSKRSASR